MKFWAILSVRYRDLLIKKILENVTTVPLIERFVPKFDKHECMLE